MIVSKSTAKQGVKLTAVSRKDSCNLELIISSQYCTSKRALIVKEYPTFKLEVTFTCKGGTYPKGLQLSFKDLPYPKDAYGEICLDKGAVIKIPISGEDYSGQLSVYRMAYMSSNVLGSLRKIRKSHRG